MTDNLLLFTAHIKEAYSKLTKKERVIADYMLANTESLLTATAEEIGAATGSSAATVIRCCRACGFNGLAELKLSLKKEHRIVDPSPVRAIDITLKPDDTAIIIKQRVLGYYNLVINNMLSDWNISAYNMAAEAIIKANRVVVIGEGGSHSSCFCLYYMLLNMGIRCEVCADSVFEIMTVDSLEKDDVVIGITYTGRIRNAIESIKYAKQKGVCTIGLVGYLDSLVIDYLDIVLNTTSVQKEYYDSEMSIRISEMIVIEILITLLSVKFRESKGEIPLENQAIDLKRIT